MCGIVGALYAPGLERRTRITSTVSAMSGKLRHRGPDDCGIWADPDAGITLGHRRLAILDLTAEGHQPMVSASGRFVLSFNGEIYNFQELQQALSLRGIRFRGRSDTEVMLAAFDEMGIPQALSRFNGMFAFALWDRQLGELTLARDRLGEKPLYYSWHDGAFVFASELKAIAAIDGYRPAINRDAIALFLRYSYVPAPHTIYDGAYKLPPGCLLRVGLARADSRAHFTPFPDPTPPPSWGPKRYWALSSAIKKGMAEPFPGTESEAVAATEELLMDSVRLRMNADVPVGVFLSGGTDSSLIAALMKASAGSRVDSFSIGFREPEFDESAFARRVAGFLGTNHHEFLVGSEEALDVLPDLPHIFDEPFADPSQLPTILLSRLTRKKVSVTLSGDGADELFGGYPRYIWAERFWNTFGYFPSTLRVPLARLVRFTNGIRPIHKFLGPPDSPNHSWIRGALLKAAEVLEIDTIEGFHERLTRVWQGPSLPLAVQPHSVRGHDSQSDRSTLPPCDYMMLRDQLNYLPDDILVKLDRATMASSLEGRLPFLDHRVLEFSWTLPRKFLLADGSGKKILKRILHKHVPRGLIERPKMGFGPPLANWLRGPLREWAHSLLSANNLADVGGLDARIIQATWAEHLSGRRNCQNQLWSVLMLAAWLQANASRLRS